MFFFLMAILSGIILSVSIFYGFFFIIGVIIVLLVCKRGNLLVLLSIVIGIMCIRSHNWIVQYNTKYQTGSYEGEFQLQSFEGETEYYQKYIGKNQQDDLFLLYVSKEASQFLELYDTVHLTGKFELPEVARNMGRL